jgi:hypothetical protein
MSIVASRGIGSLHSLGHLDVSKTIFSLIGILAAPISLQDVCLYNEINTARESLSTAFVRFWLAFTDKTRTIFRGIAFARYQGTLLTAIVPLGAMCHTVGPSAVLAPDAQNGESQ